MASELTPEAWAQIRHDYEHTDRPVDDICAEHGISSGTLRDRMRRWGWTRRRPPVPREGPPPTPAPQVEHAAPFLSPVPQIETAAPSLPAAPHAAPDDASASDPAPIARRLQDAVGRVLAAIETTVATLAAGPVHPREMERAARVLAALTRTLRELNALLSQYPAADADSEEDLNAFRAELARKIDAIVARRPTGDGAQPADP